MFFIIGFVFLVSVSFLVGLLYYKIGSFEKIISLARWFSYIYLALGFFIGTIAFTRMYPKLQYIWTLDTIGWFVGGVGLYLIFFTPLLLVLYGILFFCKKKAWGRGLVVGLFILSLLCLVVGYWQREQMKITRYEIPTENMNLKGKRIAVFSDPQFTLSNQRGHANRIARYLEKIQPEAIFIVGDLFNGEDLDLAPIEGEMKKWVTLAPVYAVTGNHEYYGDTPTFLASLRRAGITVLEDESTVWEGVRISAFRFAFTEEGREIAKKNVLKEREKGSFDIVLVHEPSLQTELAQAGAGIVFYGHTHNGQFWPFNYLVMQKYGKYIYGKNMVGGTTFITTSGTGLAGLPSRFLNTPEVVEVVFK